MSERMNLLAPAVAANPYPVYAELRRNTPVLQVDPGGMWAVSRYDDVLAVLKDPKRFSNAAYAARRKPDWLKEDPFAAPSLIAQDPPDHLKMRGLVSRSFGTTALTRMEPWLRALTSELAERVVRKGEVDFMAEFALAVPAAVICQLLGMDPALRGRFKQWADDAALINAAHPPDQIPRLRASVEEMARYFEEVLAARRSHPGEDMVSELLAAEVEGQRLTHAELMAFLRLLLLAGLDTTVNLLGNTMATLSQHPRELERVLREPSLIPELIEEVLRYETPIQLGFRRATEDVELSGGRVPAGGTVLVLFGCANRDERRFGDGDAFRLDRPDRGNLFFGHGNHFCLGANLARLEARLALEALFSRIRGFSLVGETLSWTPALTMRGLKTLPLRLEPA